MSNHSAVMHALGKLSQLALLCSAQSDASMALTRTANTMLDAKRLAEAKLAIARSEGIMQVVNACLEILNEPEP